MNQDLSNAQHILARAGQEKLMLLSMSHVSVEISSTALELAGDKRSRGGPVRWPKVGDSDPSVSTPLLFHIILVAEGI
jgi:hypothetical protein